MFFITIKEKYVPVNQQPCGCSCPKCNQKGGLLLTVYQKHVDVVWAVHTVTNQTTGSVYCEKCQSDIAVTRWSDDMEAFYLKIAQETPLEKVSKKFTWFGKFCIGFSVLLILFIAAAGIFNDEIKKMNAARKLARENQQDIVLQVGNKIELNYDALYTNAKPGVSQGSGVQWFEVAKETKKSYWLHKIKYDEQKHQVLEVEKSANGEAFYEIKKAKTGDLGFTVGGLNGAEGLYYKSEVTQVIK